MDHTSSYTQNFAGTPDEKYRETAKLEKQRVKAYQKQQNRGNLNPSVALPFKGQSTAQKEFSKRNANGVEKILPFDMVSTGDESSTFLTSSMNQWVIVLTVFHDPFLFFSWLCHTE